MKGYLKAITVFCKRDKEVNLSNLRFLGNSLVEAEILAFCESFVFISPYIDNGVHCSNTERLILHDDFKEEINRIIKNKGSKLPFIVHFFGFDDRKYIRDGKYKGNRRGKNSSYFSMEFCFDDEGFEYIKNEKIRNKLMKLLEKKIAPVFEKVFHQETIVGFIYDN